MSEKENEYMRNYYLKNPDKREKHNAVMREYRRKLKERLINAENSLSRINNKPSETV